jgi:hypothetical protein
MTANAPPTIFTIEIGDTPTLTFKFRIFARRTSGKWAASCMLSGECIKTCDYGVNPRFQRAWRNAGRRAMLLVNINKTRRRFRILNGYPFLDSGSSKSHCSAGACEHYALTAPLDFEASITTSITQRPTKVYHYPITLVQGDRSKPEA